MHSYRNSTATTLDAGLRLGVLLGGRLNQNFSLNGEMTIDSTNPNNVPAGVDVTETVVDLAFSPLVHLPAGSGDFVFGPKLGVFASEATSSGGGSASTNGTVLGLNVGAFFAVSDGASLGVLLSYELKSVDEVCVSGSCTTNIDADSLQVLGVTAAALF
jgi:hypothetical protein